MIGLCGPVIHPFGLYNLLIVTLSPQAIFYYLSIASVQCSLLFLILVAYVCDKISCQRNKMRLHRTDNCKCSEVTE